MSEFRDWIHRYYANHKDIPEGHSDGEMVRELILCKGCRKYFKNDTSSSQCRYSGNDDGYCFMAERKEE